MNHTDRGGKRTNTVWLEWKGPFNLCRRASGYAEPEPAGPGLHMYTVKVDGNYVPYDIGQSKDLGGRLMSDIVELLGG